jgi:hypothetical protein
MSFGAWHVMEMIRKQNNNRIILPSNRARFIESLRVCIEQYENQNSDPLQFKTVPKAELIRMKNEIRAQATRTNKREFVAFCIYATGSFTGFLRLMYKYY